MTMCLSVILQVFLSLYSSSILFNDIVFLLITSSIDLSLLLSIFFHYDFIYFLIISSATFIPSTAADVIPPAKPAPSPHG